MVRDIDACPPPAKRQSWVWPFSDFPATTFCKSSKSFWFASSRSARTCAFCKKMIKVSYSQLIDINWPISYSQLIQLFTVVKTIWVNVVRHRSASKVGLLSTQNISCSNPSVSHAHLTRWNPHVLHVSLFVANKGNKKKNMFFLCFLKNTKHISISFQLTRQLSSNKADFFPN